MNSTQYQTMMDGYFSRYCHAQKLHICPHTALARIRDMARLKANFTGRNFNDVLADMLERYPLQ